MPDLALLMTPARATPSVLQQCIDVGIPAAIVIGSGFSEEGSDQGKELQDHIAAMARHHGIALNGPNSEGFVDALRGFAPTFSPVLSKLDPLPEVAPRNGGRIAIVAQSGALGFGLFDVAWRRGFAVDRVITTGNEASLVLADYVDYLIDEGNTDAILLLAEGFRDGRRFLETAQRCRGARVPLVMLRIGRSHVGQRQAESHTGALAADNRMLGDLLADAGVIETFNLHEAVETAGLLAAWHKHKVAGRRVGISSSTGGGAGLLADMCNDAGLEVPELQPATRTVLDAALPSYGSSVNPVDATASGIRALGYAGITRTIADDPGIDTVIVAASGSLTTTISKETDELKELASTCVKPIVFWSYTHPSPDFLNVLGECHLPVTTNAGAIVKAIDGLAGLHEPSATTCHPTIDPPALVRGPMTEASAYPVLEALGISPGPWRLARTAEEARAAAEDIAQPVALKVQSADIMHKSEAGAVRLDVSPAHAGEAFSGVVESAKAWSPDASIEGVVVQAMASVGVEMMLGAVVDPSFGPVVMVGAGGIHAEVLEDVAFAAAPVSSVQAHRMIDRLRVRRLLDGVRGAPPADVDALATAIVTVSQLALAPGLRELDLNPVFVHQTGLTVADALIVTEGA